MKALIVLTLIGTEAWIAIASSGSSANTPDEGALQFAGDPVLTATPEFSPTWPPTPENWSEVFTPDEGIAAIQPSLASAPPGEAAVTEGDIAAYFATWDGTTIQSIEFVPGFEVERRVGLAHGELGGRLIVVVTLRGEFSFTRPPEASSLPPSVQRMTMLIDARTGNELMSWLP